MDKLIKEDWIKYTRWWQKPLLLFRPEIRNTDENCTVVLKELFGVLHLIKIEGKNPPQ